MQERESILRVRAFAELLETDDTMYVGHLPHMGKRVSYLTTGDGDAGVVRFTNGAVVRIHQSLFSAVPVKTSPQLTLPVSCIRAKRVTTETIVTIRPVIPSPVGLL